MTNLSGPNERGTSDLTKAIIAAIERENADHERRQHLPPRRARPNTGPTVVYSIRLDRDELAALDEQAAERGLKSSAFARNLIRAGLQARHNPPLRDAVERVQQCVDELRSLVR